MNETEDFLLKRALTFIKAEIEQPQSLDELLSLPCNVLHEVSEQDSQKLKTLNINNIIELAEFDFDTQKDAIRQSKLSISTFERWMLAARIISRISNYEIKGTKKIALLGLANAGKTAIRQVILRKLHVNTSVFEKIMRKLQPTKGVEREKIPIADADLQLWDMGGQETYRENYLKEPERFLLDIEVVIYVIDVQDSKKHNDAIEYLRKLAATFRTLNQKTYFLVCYHKFDQDIQQDQKYQEWIQNSWEVISGFLEEYKYPRKFFTTSIFQDFSIFNVFSEALKITVDYNIEKVINKLIAKYAQETDLQNLLLLDSNGIKLGEYINSKEENLDLLNQLYQISIPILQSISQINVLNESMKNKRFIKSILYNFIPGNMNLIISRVLLFDKSMYLITSHPEKTELDTQFTNSLMPWLSNLFT